MHRQQAGGGSGGVRSPSPVDVVARPGGGPRFGRRASARSMASQASAASLMRGPDGELRYRARSAASIEGEDAELVRRDLLGLKRRSGLGVAGSSIGHVELVAASFVPAVPKVRRELRLLRERLYDERAPLRGTWAKAFEPTDIGEVVRSRPPWARGELGDTAGTRDSDDSD
uniref:Uncharacterized protein n=1 Tax=Bicosoecida sp. CB-2014 TaxID=1486930 RepID=A0A7S1CPD9_9STRA|mmetsp:Transcript_7986/g.28513  ORF Transcript_7986/g.28513 Transcript_7986/m.28513 type:complete len:172 (+) Transcript_7986:1-516(+)